MTGHRAIPMNLTVDAASPATWFHCGSCGAYWAVLNLRYLVSDRAAVSVHCGSCGMRHRFWYSDLGLSFEQLNKDAATIEKDLQKALDND